MKPNMLVAGTPENRVLHMFTPRICDKLNLGSPSAPNATQLVLERLEAHVRRKPVPDNQQRWFGLDDFSRNLQATHTF